MNKKPFRRHPQKNYDITKTITVLSTMASRIVCWLYFCDVIEPMWLHICVNKNYMINIHISSFAKYLIWLCHASATVDI